MTRQFQLQLIRCDGSKELFHQTFLGDLSEAIACAEDWLGVAQVVDAQAELDRVPIMGVTIWSCASGKVAHTVLAEPIDGHGLHD